MSEMAEYADRLNIREQIARIDRAIDEAAKLRAERLKLDAEAAKLVAETAKHSSERVMLEVQASKLGAEAAKYSSERVKLEAEASKLARDRFLAPALALAATLGAIATFAPAIIRAIGGHG